MPDGTAGALSYQIPWEQVDQTLSTQSLALSDFCINIAGQNITSSLVSFTVTPTVQFEYGEMVGITFTAVTSTLTNFPYQSLAMSSLTVAAQSVGGPLFQVAAHDAKPAVSFLLIHRSTDTKDTVLGTDGLRSWLQTQYGTFNYSTTLPVGTKVVEAVDILYNQLVDAGWDVKKSPGERGLQVYGWKNAQGEMEKLIWAGIHFADVEPEFQARIGKTPEVVGLIYKNGNWEEGNWWKP